MLTIAPDALAISVDADQIGAFVRSLFGNASPGGIISLRAFPQDREGKALFIRNFEIEDDGLDSVISGAIAGARAAAKAGGVFSPPVAVFKDTRNAAERNIAEAVAISVECDERAAWARQTLTGILGAPTLTVASGGIWVNPDTGAAEDKMHLHWRLAVPARDPESLALLKLARTMACDLVGADRSCIPPSHPLRWAGSLHMKAAPRLCRIVESTDNEIDLTEAFALLREVTPADVRREPGKVSPAKTRTPHKGKVSPTALADIAELTEAMQFVPNNFARKDSWNEWTAIGMALFAATNGSEQGLALFDAFSQKSPLYDAQRTRDRWLGIAGSPPSQTGQGKIFAIAIANGWRTKPTYAVADFTATDKARTEVGVVFNRFFTRNVWQTFADEINPPTWCLRVECGIGKTTLVVAAIDEVLKADPAKRFIFFGATLELCDEIAAQFRARGIVARVYRGRAADDPDAPGNEMCLDPGKVEVAVKAKLDVTKNCCRRGKSTCELHEQCGYQRQLRDTKPVQVWIAASDMAFHAQTAFAKFDYAIFYERYYPKALRGIEDRWEFRLSNLQHGTDPKLRKLGQILERQNSDGGLLLRYVIEAGDHHSLTALIVTLFDEMPSVEMQPDWRPAQFAAFMKRHANTIKRIQFTWQVIKILEEIRHQLLHEIPVSGRLLLEHDSKGRRVLAWRGVANIKQQFQLPSLVLDATLPDLSILRVLHPNAELKADVRVALPSSVYVEQIVRAPSSKTKLIDGEHSEKHREEVLRLILQKWIETGRGKALVISYMDFEEWLTGKLPPEIATAHFNSIAGLDAHRDVRLLIVIGRPQPGPQAVESIAAALTGMMPECIGDDDVTDRDNNGENDNDGGQQFAWYRRERRGIRLRDGTGRAVMVDVHPDPLCEALRMQIVEAELEQAFGRARAVNRTDETPLTAVLLFDNVLPLSIDDVARWRRPSLFITTAATAGVMLGSPVDLMKVWPQLFPNKSAADRAVAKGIPELLGFELVRYRPVGPKMKWRTTSFDRALIRDPAAWLERHFGPVEVEP